MAGAIDDTIATMKNFGLNFNEGMIDESNEIGNYGPYKQSLRGEIYKTFAKDLVKRICLSMFLLRRRN